MADDRAIGGVSATLQALLLDRVEFPPGATPAVSVSTPRRDDDQPDRPETPRLNLFLYRVAESPFLKNQEMPGRAAYGHPPLSLTLHYLLTAYGSDGGLDGGVPDETPAHLLLGSAMRVLHEQAVITGRATTRRPPLGRPLLHGSLRDESEQVKLVLEPLSLEDVTKVWTALTLRYRLSTGYTVSVVRIEGQQPRAFPRLVGEPPAAGPRTVVMPFRQPHVAEVRVRRPGETVERTTPYARVGDTLVLLGHGMAGTGTRAVLGILELEPAATAEGRLEVEVPGDDVNGEPIPPEARLQPGAHAASVAVRIPPLPGTPFRSNHAAFMLVPRIDAAAASTADRLLTVDGSRLYRAGVPCEAIVGGWAVPGTAYRAPTPERIRIPLPGPLPERDVPVLVSAAVTLPAVLPDPPSLRLKAGTEAAAFSFSLEAAPALPDIARAIQAAARGAAEGRPAFRGLRVGVSGGRLLLVAGGFRAALAVETDPGDPRAAEQAATAAALGLGPGAPATVAGFLSAEVPELAPPAAAQPAVEVELAGDARTVTLAARPGTLAEAAAGLQAALPNAVSPDGTPAGPAFTGARVALVGDRLLVASGAPGAGARARAAAGDPDSAAALRLVGRYAVRVRVNGAEAIDDVSVELPA